MEKRTRKSVSVWLAVIFILAVSTIADAQEQKIAPAVSLTKNREVKSFYVNGLVALGFDIYKSDDINKIFLDEYNIQTAGFPFQYGIRAGFRHIAQFEFHASSSSSHNLGRITDYVNGQWVGETINMKLKASDMLFKINPFFWSWMKSSHGRPAKCMFVVIGAGKATYKDKTDEGFEGSGMIYGLEYGMISKFATLSLGMTIQNITYDRDKIHITGYTATSDLKASRFVLYTSLGLGYGI